MMSPEPGDLELGYNNSYEFSESLNNQEHGNNDLTQRYGATRLPDQDRKRSSASLSTRLVLQKFPIMRSLSTIDPDDAERKATLISEWLKQRTKIYQTIKNIEGNSQLARGSILRLIKKYFLWSQGRNAPTKRKDALDACWHFFPPRGDLMVRVCDFGPGKSNVFEAKLGESSICLKIRVDTDTKPEWATVRWIHVPIGRGPLHSTIQDLFNHAGNPGRPFEKAGSIDWPYVRMEITNFHSLERCKESFKAFEVLTKESSLRADIETKGLHSLDEIIREDLEERADVLGRQINFWDMVKSDFPGLLSEENVIGQQGPLDSMRQGGKKPEEQILSEHLQYHGALLTANAFRAYHRDDGCILTCTGSTGIDYLDKQFGEYLDESKSILLDNEQASVLAHASQAFLDSGTDTWHRKTVEWFMVYLLTEIAVTPHNIRQGRSAISVLNAYKEIIMDMKEKRKRPWKRGKTVKLVRRFLDCTDELRAIKSITIHKIRTFRRMLEDCEQMENEDIDLEREVNSEGESSPDIVRWGISMLEEQERDSTKLLDQLNTALNELFQISSIEQNDLAIVADSQNKAILLFTGVTVVFLPLSFFTSYFGMNLKGIIDTTKTQVFFWKTCGTIAFVLVTVIGSYAFHTDILYHLMHRNVKKPLLSPEDESSQDKTST